MSSHIQHQSNISEHSAPAVWWRSNGDSDRGQSRVGGILTATLWFVGGNPGTGPDGDDLRAWLRADDTPAPEETRLLSEASLATDWSRPEEAEAWAFMQERGQP